MLRVGLTGNIASGKSQAAHVFAELGARIIDADVIAREALESGTDTYEKVIDAFGKDILDANGSIDRRKLGGIVFGDAGRRANLNSIVHPHVREEIFRRIHEYEKNSPCGIVVVDAALLVESGSYLLYDRLIVVTCDPGLQLSRLIHRDGLTEQQAKARIAAQLPVEEKLKLADYTIDTSGTLKETRDQIEAVYRDLVLRELRQRGES
ncbi:MAG TPA: dephospho-CoA kinase [Acidobacteriota bacterium]|nr:dephospho-CoA kinase [Acidobacteriota bacterium]